MGVYTYTDENVSPIPPARLFKALILDSQILIPKLLPQLVKSIDFIEGNGGAGSIRQVTFHEGHQAKSIKTRIDAIDPEKCSYTYTYTLIEGDGLLDKVESIVYEVEFEDGADGGSINKMKSTYNAKGDFVLNEEEVKAGKEKALAMYKVVEAYLLQNPDAYV